MAGMSDLTWYSITLAPFSDPSWVAASYSAPPYITDAVASGGIIPVFCVYNLGAGDLALISYLGGTCNIPSDAVTIAGTLTMNTSTLLSGETWYSVRWPSGGSGWQWYSSASGLVKSLDPSSTLGAFID